MWMRAALFSLGTTSLFAFSPNAKGWHGASEISPAISYTNYQANHYYTQGSGESSLLGLNFQQSVGWKNLATLDFTAAFATSLGARASDGQDSISAHIYTWDIGSTLYTSLGLERTRTVFLEPALGFSALIANMCDMIDGDMQRSSRLTYQGPSVGLYMRFFPLSHFGVRVGGMYMMARLRNVVYPESGGDEPQFVMKATARRHGLLAALHLDYQLRHWVTLTLGIEQQSWSSGGKFQAQYGNLNPYFRRTRLSWGAKFNY